LSLKKKKVAQKETTQKETVKQEKVLPKLRFEVPSRQYRMLGWKSRAQRMIS